MSALKTKSVHWVPRHKIIEGLDRLVKVGSTINLVRPVPAVGMSTGGLD